MTDADRHEPGRIERWALRRIDAEVDRLDERYGDRDPPEVGHRSVMLSVWGAAAVGFVFSGLVAVFEIQFFQNPFDFHADYWWHTGLYLAAAIGFTAIETYYLIVFGLRTTARLARCVAPPYEPPTLRALSRAVVEIPEPELRPLGLDPEKHVRRESEILWYIAYRLKFMASNVIAKMVARRLLTRAGFRSWAPLVAAPVVAVWNAWVMWMVLTEAKYRLMGRLAARDIIRDADRASPALHRALTMFVSVRLVLYEVYNHNFDYLLRELYARYEGGEPPPLDDWDAFTAALAELDDDERAVLDRVALVLFALKRRRLSRRERARAAELAIEPRARARVARHVRRLDGDALLAVLSRAPAGKG